MIVRGGLVLALGVASVATSGSGRRATVRVERASYPDGSPMWVRHYRDGVADGLHEGWWPDGTVKFSYWYERGEREGEAREWHANGALYHIATYRRGREDGHQELRDVDGSIRASYDVVDGRRYGSIGAMGCTPGDSLRASGARKERR